MTDPRILCFDEKDRIQQVAEAAVGEALKGP